MFDGIKIECAVANKKQFKKHLNLIGRFNESSGEVLPLPYDAEKNACRFQTIPGLVSDKFIFQGSLHRYARKGRENDDDFTLSEVIQTINELKEKYSIIPEKSKVINFEFGVNINLPPGIGAQDFQKYLVSAYSKSFEKLNPKKPAVGYIAEFNEFSIKVYDKGYQARNGSTDQIRVEIKVNRTRWLDQFGIIKGKDLMLSDLINSKNIELFGDILENKVSSLILTPRDVETKQLTPKQRLTFYECRDARSWEEWNSKQRERKREQLKKIFIALKQDDPVEILRKLVVEKWGMLATLPIETPGAQREKTTEKGRIFQFIVDGIFAILKVWFYSVVEKFAEYLPRGKPLIRGKPIAELLKHIGFNRWIDSVIRPPPDSR